MKPDPEYIEVAVAVPVFQTFTYSAPENIASLVSAGKRVLIPFGRRRITGYVLGPSQGVDQKEVKSVLDVLDDQPLFPPAMVPFFRWISDYYKYPLGEVIKNALPGGLNVRDYALVALTADGQNCIEGGQLNPIAKQILCHLQSGPCRVKELFNQIDRGIPGALLYSLEQQGLIAHKWELSKARAKARRERFVQLTGVQPEAGQLSRSRAKVLEVLAESGEISVKQLKKIIPTSAALIKPLEKAGYVSIQSKRVYRDPFGKSIKPDSAPVLNREQARAVERISDFFNQGYKAFLLRGVTGSGKTEVYMRVADKVIKSGRCVLVLVPEIALITQMERRFRARFGDGVGVLHSGLSAGERFDQWTRIMQGEATIVIGARSAIFAPLADIGIIIVDEEHDSSYKQEGQLRYNARDLAVVRARQIGCLALLGSATPSVQSYHNTLNGKFSELTLTKRVERRPLPEISIVDLRESRDTRGTGRYISPQLQQAMRETLEHGEQVLLFLNRRGFASFPVCATCGQPMRCKHCDISLTLHQHSNAYRCHYCGFSRSALSKCEVCGSDKIKLLGLGTEKLEGMVAKLFPDARLARMDRDTTTRKGSILKLLKGLRDKTTDILVGTQMVAKGHDFPNITLVGIICADLSLSFPDFRAGERTFQLLAQVAGRAGRGDRSGRVILQTYNPDHFSIEAAREQDFLAFYNQEIEFRKTLNYPPFSRVIQLKISGKDSRQTRNQADLLGERCRSLKADDPAAYQSIDLLGPIESSLTRIARRYRRQILLKGSNTRKLHQFVNQLMTEHPALFNHRQVKVAIDVDPFFMM
ncbi:MAG: primosomal protein N' [Desulfobacterales bacterium]